MIDSRHLWSLYAIYIASFQTPAVVVDGLLAWLLYKGLAGNPSLQNYTLGGFGIWLVLTKTLKLVPHLTRHPLDIVYLPASIVFSYLHGIINIYAVLTMHVVSSRERDTQGVFGVTNRLIDRLGFAPARGRCRRARGRKDCLTLVNGPSDIAVSLARLCVRLAMGGT